MRGRSSFHILPVKGLLSEVDLQKDYWRHLEDLSHIEVLWKKISYPKKDLKGSIKTCECYFIHKWYTNGLLAVEYIWEVLHSSKPLEKSFNKRRSAMVSFTSKSCECCSIHKRPAKRDFSKKKSRLLSKKRSVKVFLSKAKEDLRKVF